MNNMGKIIWRAISICFLVLAILIFLVLETRDYIIRHPIQIQHPLPQYKRYIPILGVLDDWLCLTGGIDFYTVIDKATRRKYLVFFGYNEKERKDDIRIMDYELRDRFISINRKDYLKRFDHDQAVGLTKE